MLAAIFQALSAIKAVKVNVRRVDYISEAAKACRGDFQLLPQASLCNAVIDAAADMAHLYPGGAQEIEQA